MRLLLGPAYQGKLAYLRGALRVPEPDIHFCSPENPALETGKPAVCGLHLWVRAVLAAGLVPEKELAKGLGALAAATILADELGGGIVPLAREDRRWREANGRCLRLLAERADSVLRFTAGIPAVLKGSLPGERTLLLLRHGVSEAALAHTYSGWMDVPLTEAGREELRARRYPAAELYACSPLSRAAESLRLLFGDVEYRALPGLRECSFGAFEGHTHGELAARVDYQAWIADDTGGAVSPPGGETRLAHAARVRAAMERLLQEGFRTAAVVCHGGTIVRLMEGWFPGERDFYGWQPACGEGWRVVFRDGVPISREAVNGREAAPC